MLYIVKCEELRSLRACSASSIIFVETVICLIIYFVTNNCTGTKMKSGIDINQNHTNATLNISVHFVFLLAISTNCKRPTLSGNTI